MPPEDLADALTRVSHRFDLGEYETDAYLAVLEHGRLTAANVADRTDIPQPRVYDTVRNLEERGLVELRESRPIEVLAVDPAEAFEDVHTSLDTLVTGLKTRYTAPARDTAAASLVKSRTTVLRQLETVIEGAEYELIISLTPTLIGRFEESLADRCEAGITTELLVTPATDAPAADDYDYSAVATSVRARRGITTPVLAVADGTHAVYATQDALTADSERYGVVFNRSELGFLVSGFFETLLWTTADVLFEGGDGRSFPRRYASMRRCVADLAESEGEFTAVVEGRDVETGEQCSVRGAVVDSTTDPTNRTATITVETDEEEVVVGGQVAAFEDVEAHELRIERR